METIFDRTAPIIIGASQIIQSAVSFLPQVPGEPAPMAPARPGRNPTVAPQIALTTVTEIAGVFPFPGVAARRVGAPT